MSLFYITHDLLSARVVTDELFMLNQGRVAEQGRRRTSDSIRRATTP